MANRSHFNGSSLNFAAYILVPLYLCIGFIPNWQAVDKIAPQWLIMSGLNLVSLVYFIKNRKTLSNILTLSLKSKLSVTYMAFILWGIGSIFYAINSIEVIVNLARQLNVFLMFFSMTVFAYNLKNKLVFTLGNNFNFGS